MDFSQSEKVASTSGGQREGNSGATVSGGGIAFAVSMVEV